MLVASELGMVRLEWRREDKKRDERTKETKIARMNDCFCVCFTRQVIERRKPASDISNAEYSAMDRVYKLCLGVDLVRAGRRARTSGGRGRTRSWLLHFFMLRWLSVRKDCRVEEEGERVAERREGSGHKTHAALRQDPLTLTLNRHRDHISQPPHSRGIPGLLFISVAFTTKGAAVSRAGPALPLLMPLAIT